MGGVYRMSTSQVKNNLHTPKDFWNEAVTDANRKIAKMRDRIKSLELAREVFRKNALEKVPIPGRVSAERQDESTTHN
jgi:hypothetical protein